MKPELRALVFCLTVLFLAPALYGVGEWLGSTAAALLLPGAAIGASLLYARAGERRDPPTGTA